MKGQTDQQTFIASPRAKLILALVCAAGALDFIDTTIVNVALPSIGARLHFSAQDLQWVVSGYLLTYGGLLLLGGRAADFLGRRRMLLTGTSTFGLSSMVAGLANTSGTLVGARLVQGVGAAMMTPAALSILTTTFRDGPQRIKAMGAWSAMVPVASALGVVLSGVLSEGLSWRWVFFVNVPVALAVLVGGSRALPGDPPLQRLQNFDVGGAVLATGGMLLLVYALVQAPDLGWGSGRTVGELVGAGTLLAAFAVNEQRHRNPLFPFTILRIRGVAAADTTQVIANAGFLSMFFFVTLYMQTVLGLSPVWAGLAYLPVTVSVGMATGIAVKLLPRTGARPLIVVGCLVGAGGVFWLSRIAVHGSYVADVLPGLIVMAIGLGGVLFGVQTAANAGVPADKAGLAASLIQTSSTLGATLGLAILSAIATGHTDHLLAAHVARPAAVTSGFSWALVACSIFLVAAALVAVRVRSSRAQATPRQEAELVPELAA
jgi:EmrB/QacA subfamily drug resistance transporter